ncbi:alpha/beta fold hydrolase [Bacillus salitolerans]|uniref:Alpha/beta fold hydrolase n=1 Tax=Bacillus salitolerans TaxID=1437434 RepID=A0ABW4LWJ4_9BACI
MDVVIQNQTIHYEIYGEGKPLFIFHAMGTDHRSMKAWIEPVFQQEKSDWKRIYVDIPGHGGSNQVVDIKNNDEMLDILLELIDVLVHDQPFSLVGMSFGGYLAQGIMHKRINQVEGICLLAPALHTGARSTSSKKMMETNEEVLNKLDQEIVTAIHTLLVYQTKENIQLFLEEVQPGRLLANRKFLTSEWKTKGYFFSFEPFAHMSEIDKPALLVLGKNDSIVGFEDHMKLAGKFQHVSYAVLDRAGHLLQIEARNRLIHLFMNWLERITKTQ